MSEDGFTLLPFDRERLERGQRLLELLADARARLVPVTDHVERVADARTAEYGRQVDRVLDAFDRCEQNLHDLHDMLADLRSLADRMQGISTAAPGTSLDGVRREPQGEGTE